MLACGRFYEIAHGLVKAAAVTSFPPAWPLEEQTARFVMRDCNGQQLA
jgi:hypothetical protein